MAPKCCPPKHETRNSLWPFLPSAALSAWVCYLTNKKKVEPNYWEWARFCFNLPKDWDWNRIGSIWTQRHLTKVVVLFPRAKALRGFDVVVGSLSSASSQKKRMPSITSGGHQAAPTPPVSGQGPRSTLLLRKKHVHHGQNSSDVSSLYGWS